MSGTDFGKQDGVDLKSLFEARCEVLHTLITANDKNYNQRFENVIQATQAALAAADRAVNKAEAAAEKRFEGVNEFRGQLQDQQRTFMPRAEVELLTKAINEKIDSLNETTISKQSKDVGQREGIGTVAGIAGVVSIIVAILFKFIK